MDNWGQMWSRWNWKIKICGRNFTKSGQKWSLQRLDGKSKEIEATSGRGVCFCVQYYPGTLLSHLGMKTVPFFCQVVYKAMNESYKQLQWYVLDSFDRNVSHVEKVLKLQNDHLVLFTSRVHVYGTVKHFTFRVTEPYFLLVVALIC